LSGDVDESPAAATIVSGVERDDPGPRIPAADGPAAEPEPELPPKRLMAERFVARARSAPSPDAHRLGYLRAGALHMAKTGRPVGFDGCKHGWYELEGGGFVCTGAEVIAFEGSKLPSIRPLQPDLEAPLPYPYARLKRKAPLYRRLPTLEEAAEVEGYSLPPEEAPASPDAGVVDAGAPVKAPPPTLDELLGRRGSIVQRTGIKGFTLSLDRSYERYGRTYYRTHGNGFIGAEHLVHLEGSNFRGLELDEESSLPVAFRAKKKGSAMAFEMRDNGRLRPVRGKALQYHGAIRIRAEETVGQAEYVVSEDGLYFLARDLVVVRSSDRPGEVGEDEKWLDIDLTHQTLVAYVGDRPVFATLVSTGRIRKEGDPERDHRTPKGVFRVRAKHLTHTMDGDSAVDGPYSIDDVPYVQYFHGAYAIHTAFWHDRFGTPRSHGCVNLAPEDSKFIYAFTEPTPREGWHGTYPAEGEQGTAIRVRGETPHG
jgi:hypothetical protein